VLRHFGLEDEYGAYVETQSNIPIARGLKSSSAAANAVTLASLNAIGKKVNDLTAINIGVDAALESRVTITGAFDDACASFFGGVVITDNLKRKILKKINPPEYLILIHVPKTKSYTASSNVQKMKLMANEVKALHKIALQGDWLDAMTLNGLVYSAVLGIDTNLVIDALDAGALAAGLSGKGPAVAAVVLPEKVYDVKETWKKYGGTIIETQINTIKAHKV
ncbi:shikimate kinase, partial [Candidatus Bathyarchaeota archaeon]|nr:shikimate kinase [Candidatus Bathyarchaeota archaeon]